MDKLLPIICLLALAPMLSAGPSIQQNIFPVIIQMGGGGGGYLPGYGISISTMNVISYTGTLGYSAGTGISIDPFNVMSATGGTTYSAGNNIFFTPTNSINVMPAGGNQQVQYYDAAKLGASSSFTFNDLNKTLDVIGDLNTNSITGTYTGAQFRLGNKQLIGDYLGFFDQRASTDTNTAPGLGFYLNNVRQGVVAYDSGIPYQIFYSDSFQNGLYLYPGGVGIGGFATGLSQKFQVPNTGNVTITSGANIYGLLVTPHIDVANSMDANVITFNTMTQQTVTGSLTVNSISANDITAVVTGSTNRLFATPADPSGTSSGTFVMMGLGSGLTLTPKYSGTVDIQWECHATATSTDTVRVALAYGTGTAPVNGAAKTGTQIFAPAVGYLDLRPDVNTELPAVFTAEVKGLSPGTAYWFDAMLMRSAGSGTVAIDDCMMSLTEMS